MLQVGTIEDAAEIDRFLAGYAETSMFLRSNLAAHGIGQSDSAYATDFWVQRAAGEVQAVFGATRRGYLMCQAPNADLALMKAWANDLAGRRVVGMTGVPEQVDLALDALGLSQAPFALAQTEPLYARQLPMAPLDVALRRPRPSDADVLTDWFMTYETDTGLSTGKDDLERARARGPAAAEGASDVWIMEEDGEPVAMSAINARVADLVQIGGVFVPRDKRNKGRGGAVVQAMLARQDGARRAILFANNPPAARAYERIGFEWVGQYRVMLLATPTVVGNG